MNDISCVGWWYATGPSDRLFSKDDPNFSVFHVVSDTSETEGCVTIENQAGQRFPLDRTLLGDVAASPGQIWDAKSKEYVVLV